MLKSCGAKVLRQLFCLNGRWRPAYCPAAMRQSLAVQLLALVNGGFRYN